MINGTSVSFNDFNSFLNDIITPLFPMGLTVHNTDGQKIEKEKSFVVVLVHKSTLLNNENVNKIINLYRTQF